MKVLVLGADGPYRMHFSLGLARWLWCARFFRNFTKNSYVDSGHGLLSWTLACGSGRAITDIISYRAPDADLHGLNHG
jgi:hypothetical protein